MAEDDEAKSLISIDDLSGLGGVGKKIIGAVEKATGRFYRPRAIRREATAEADAKRVLAKGQADANKTIAEADIEIWERAQERLIHQEVRRQKNIDAVVGHAIEHAAELGDDPQPDAVDEDWMAQFLNRARDVGHEEMQEVWGRVLAREAANSGSFSFRSLETLSRMTPGEAAIFQKARHLSTDQGNIFKPGSAMDEFLTVDDVLILRSAGLLHDGDLLSVSCTEANSGRYGWRHNGFDVVFAHESKKYFELSEYLLTPVGCELARLIDPNPNFGYFAALKEHLGSKNYQLTFLDSENKEIQVNSQEST